jgi:septum formation protein
MRVLTLASASPRRRELLERAGLLVRVLPAPVDEEPLGGENAIGYVKRLAREKASAGVRRIAAALGNDPRSAGDEPPRWVLAADTVVTVDELLLGKPSDVAEARAMIERLEGREHCVVTGFALLDLERNKEGIQAVTTRVRFKPMSRAEIETYLAAGESMDKAGAYAIQGVGAYLVEEIVGSYTNVVGLPVAQVCAMLEEMGAWDLLPYPTAASRRPIL